MNDPLVLDRPVIGWVGGDSTPDGVLDVHRLADWTEPVMTAPACAEHPSAAVSTGRRPRRVAATHGAPAPLCSCGMQVHPDRPGAPWRDLHRDRLGPRMQAAALVAVWGRVLIDGDGVRGQYGRVIALLVQTGEPERRRRRIEDAARRLGAQLVEFDGVTWREFDALADRYGAAHGVRMGRRSRIAILRRRDVRRWREVGSSRVDLQACKLEYSIVSPK